MGDYLKLGDKIEVLCTKIDHVQGSIKLSRKKLLQMRKETHTDDASQPISPNQEGLAINSGPVGTAEEPISIEHYPGEDKTEMQAQDSLIDDSLNNAVQKNYVGNEMERINQSLSTLQELDEQFSSDNNTDDIVIGSDTDVEDEKVSLGDGASEHIETRTSKMAKDHWMERYNELKQFQTANGNCSVPNSHIRLANWVKYQRKRYREGDLSVDRVQRLNGLGFSLSQKGVKEAKWDQRFNELKQFNTDNSNYKEPKNSLTHKELGNWANYQRTRYRKGLLSDDRIQRLNALGFTWSSND